MRNLLLYWPEAVRGAITVAFLATLPAGTPPAVLLIALPVIWLAWR